MVRIPPITTILEWVPALSPTIKPRVVIMPDVKPKLSPVFNEIFTLVLYQILKLERWYVIRRTDWASEPKYPELATKEINRYYNFLIILFIFKATIDQTIAVIKKIIPPTVSFLLNNLIAK